MEQSFGLSGSISSTISGVAVRTVDTTQSSANYTVRLRQFGIVYGIRFNLAQWNSGSVSIGSPIMAGFSFSGNYHSFDTYQTPSGIRKDTVSHLNRVLPAFEIPVILDLNIGLHSAGADSKQRFGLYAGAGYVYSYTKIPTSIGKIPYDGFDPVIRAGIRFGRSWEGRASLGVLVRGGFNNNSPRTYELHFLKEL